MRIGSLFSGAGGLDMAVQNVFGGEVVWHSEIDPAASKVLSHHWPDTPNIGDITCIDWDVWDDIIPDVVVPVDVLCGGWPCQPFSIAGRKKGIHDDRALWPYVARAIRSLRPQYIVLENVSAVLRAGEFDRVAADLAQAGYRFTWMCLRASDIGAPHHRERLFITASLADTQSPRLERPLPGTDETTHPRHVSNSGLAELTCLSTPQARDSKVVPKDGYNEKCLARDVIECENSWGKYLLAVGRWQCVTGRKAPKPTIPGERGFRRPRLNPQFSEWMMGWPIGWVSDIELSRKQTLTIIGNGVVPQQAEAAINIGLERLGV